MPLDRDALTSLALPRDAGRGGSARRGWLVLPVLAVAVAGTYWLAGRRPVVVETRVVEAPSASGRTAVLNASGYVVARRTATVASKVTGRVQEVLTEEGRSVARDEVLARLDPSTVQKGEEVAHRQVESARRALTEIEVRLADAKRTRERNERLIGEHLVSQSALDTSRADVDALEARLAASRSELGVAEANLRSRRQDLDDLVIRAPFAGVVIARSAQPGEMVSPISAGGGYTRTGIATIVDMTSREVEVDVNESFIQRVAAGQAVEAVLDAYPDWTLPGHVIAIVPAADRQKATVKVRIGFDALDPKILPDMGVKVRFLSEPSATGPHPVAFVPGSALGGSGPPSRVRVVENGRVSGRAVSVGAADGERVAILDGLKPGEIVVVKAPDGLRDGEAVTVKAPAP